MRLIDSHAHLQAEAFAHDLPGVVEASRTAGIERLLVPGWDRPSSERALKVAAAWPWLDAAVGIHPHGAAEASAADWDEIRRLGSERTVVAIGETGLDFDRLFSPAEVQVENLRRHLSLAIETGKPVILHCRSAAGGRDAQDALLAELRAAGFGSAAAQASFGSRPPGILHSFSGPPDYAQAALAMGLAISISGLAFRRGEEATAGVATGVPSERLLVETDAPYLPPPGAPRRRNAPEWVKLTAAWLAETRQMSPDDLGDGLIEAYDRTFPRPNPRED